ncbi:hypothetical protein [Reichenbachiella sp.]|uniref:hypothetical protein n=1 Tax=Reichenbachiella sp. TaxID=2184521 RepID=UPI003BAFEAEA
MSSYKKAKILRLLILYLGVFAAVLACEEDVEPTVSDPSVSIFFLNKDSLDAVNLITDSLSIELEEYDSIIIALQDSADLLVDSLITLTDSLANGGDLKDDSTTVAKNIILLNESLDVIEKEDSVVNASYSGWVSTTSIITSGSVKISSIENKKNGLSITYEDSSTAWKLPLDMQADDVDVAITIADSVYNLEISYSRTTVADEKNKVVISASDFQILNTDFKNPYLSCNGCEASKTTIYVEF